MGTLIRSRFRAAAGTLLAVVLAVVGSPLPGAGEIRISMDRGRVTLVATDAPLADVIAEWSRVGDMRFVGAETLGGEAITLHLIDAAEGDAIRLLLRSAAGYVAAPRRPGAPGAARYNRVTILAPGGTSAPARIRPAAPVRGGAVAAAVPAADDPSRPSSEAPALVRMEELQRLLDAAATDASGAPPGAAPDPPAAPVVTTPFPGVGSDPGSSPLPERWRRDRRPTRR